MTERPEYLDEGDDVAAALAKASSDRAEQERAPKPNGSRFPAGLPPFSEEALALRFADRHVEDLRFVAAWNRWLKWDGKRWQFASQRCAQ